MRSETAETSKHPRVLHLAIAVGECNSTYNEYAMPRTANESTFICTYFPCDMRTSEAVKISEGNGSITGFIRSFKNTLTKHRINVVHAHSPHLACIALLALIGHPRRWSHLVYTMHSCFENYKFRNKLLLVPVFLTYGRIVCCGKASRDSLPRWLRFLVGKRLNCIPNGVNIDRLDAASSVDLLPTAKKHVFNITTVGKLAPIKNHLTLLKAWQHVADGKSKLTVIGGGQQFHQIASAVAELDEPDSVELTGEIRRNEVFARLRDSELFVSASLGEGLPVAVLEAMACECPVILSDIPSHREIAADASFIPLVPAQDDAVLTNEIRKFREMPGSQRAAIGAMCRRHVEDRFPLSLLHARYDHVYSELSRLETDGDTDLPLLAPSGLEAEKLIP